MAVQANTPQMQQLMSIWPDEAECGFGVPAAAGSTKQTAGTVGIDIDLIDDPPMYTEPIE